MVSSRATVQLGPGSSLLLYVQGSFDVLELGEGSRVRFRVWVHDEWSGFGLGLRFRVCPCG